jgi:glycerol-3-phosphate cytidylyltransferase-like family protein
MGKRGGKPSKDAPISDNFNRDKQGVLSARELHRAEVARANAAKGRAVLAAKWERERLERADPNYVPPVVKGADPELDDGKSPGQMLEDMRYVYRAVKGREKLKKLMREDKQFVVMVKELMKIESALLSAKIRVKEDTASANQMVFVVLKGLEDEGKIEGMKGGIPGVVDVRQVAGMVNPDGSEYVKEEG